MDLANLRRTRDDYDAALEAAERCRGALHEAIRALHASGVPQREIAAELEITPQRVSQIIGDVAAAAEGTIGPPRDVRNFLSRFTDSARRVVQRATEAAAVERSSEVAIRHVLLGLLRERGIPAERLLRRYGLTEEMLVARASAGSDGHPERFSEGLKAALQHALDEARELAHTQIDTLHLVMGVTADDLAEGSALLREVGIHPGEVREATLRAFQGSRGVRLQVPRVDLARLPTGIDATTRGRLKKLAVFQERGAPPPERLVQSLWPVLQQIEGGPAGQERLRYVQHTLEEILRRLDAIERRIPPGRGA